MPDIGEWLDRIGLSEYRELFSNNRIDLNVLPDIGEDDLKDIGVPLGDRKRLMRAIRDLSPDDPVPNFAATSLGHARRSHGRRSGAPRRARDPRRGGARGRAQAGHRPVRRRKGLHRPDRSTRRGGYRDPPAPRRGRDEGRGERYGGTVSKLLGDGIMAVFGAPLSHEDHAVRACYAALAMQSDMRAVTEEARRRFGAEVLVRVGIVSGEVVVRTTHKDLKLVDYDAIGPTVHLAARMEQLRRPAPSASPGARSAWPRASSRHGRSARSLSRAFRSPSRYSTWPARWTCARASSRRPPRPVPLRRPG